MIEAYKKFWKGYVDFTGRSTRSDYWLNVLAQCLVSLLFGFLLILIMILGGDPATYTSNAYSFQMILIYIALSAFGIYMLALLIPSIAIMVRRLRDSGYHWALIFLALIPYLGSFVIFILTLQPTKVELPFNNLNNPQQ